MTLRPGPGINAYIAIIDVHFVLRQLPHYAQHPQEWQWCVLPGLLRSSWFILPKIKILISIKIPICQAASKLWGCTLMSSVFVQFATVAPHQETP